MSDLSLELRSLRARYAQNALTPSGLVSELWPRLEQSQKKQIWTELFSQDALLAAARALEARKAQGETLPLYGIPFAVKDNIDMAGHATTAAWPALSTPVAESAPIVERMLQAGALCVGKTNLDQLATGLVGVRSPYGVPENPFDPKRIPGGSSSGSAVAVARGLVCFALGTDTAGSGRVPAGFNNVVGLKPTRGLFSRRGVLPACKSLDGISIFALTVTDASEIAGLCQGYDARDPYSRPDAARVPFQGGALPKGFRFGVPGDAYLSALSAERRAPWLAALARLERLGGVPTACDFGPFARTAELLYEGAFIAERHASLRDIVGQRSAELLPVIAALLGRAAQFSASDAFATEHELARLKRLADQELDKLELLVVPTAMIFPTIAEVEAEPIALNQKLGALMNFGNLLDLAALAVPSALDAAGLPFGITLYGPRDSDARLAAIGAAFQRDVGGKLGATTHAITREAPPSPAATGMPLAVVGAHLSGQPLNHQLTRLDGSLLRACKTADKYRLYALKGTVPPKPGLERVASGGVAIEVEVWQLSPEAFGRFMQGVPAPLAIGTIELEDGSSVHGFLCEPFALRDATDISEHGGWRAYLAANSR